MDPIGADVSLGTGIQGCTVAVALEVISVAARGDAVAEGAEIHGYKVTHPGAHSVVVVCSDRRPEMHVQIKEVGEPHAADRAGVRVTRALTVADALLVSLTPLMVRQLSGTGAEHVTSNTMVRTVGGSSRRVTRHSCE